MYLTASKLQCEFPSRDARQRSGATPRAVSAKPSLQYRFVEPAAPSWPGTGCVIAGSKPTAYGMELQLGVLAVYLRHPEHGKPAGHSPLAVRGPAQYMAEEGITSG
jgi:hypothetical protein